jgi:PAS domain S-box-containing protein
MNRRASGADSASAADNPALLNPDIYAHIFEQCVDALLITTGQGLIVSANRRLCALLDTPREQLVGQTIDAVHPTLYEDTRWRTLPPGGELILQTHARTGSEANTRHLPIEVLIKRIVYGDHDYLQWSERDRSAHLRAEEAREDQLAMVFHDLRSPLGNVISSLEMLNAALPQDERSGDLNMLADIALRSSRRITHLLNELLDIRRLEAGQPLDREPAPLQAIVMDATDQLQSIAQSRHVSLITRIPDDLPEVLVDYDLIQRVVYNLLDNAIKHTRAYTDVTLSAEALPESNAILLTLADNGPGVPPEYQVTIFDKYQRIKREGAPKGLGLGLALCRMAAEAHGGHIWVENTPGGGATFKLILPSHTL